ncbi:MAG TPA: alpha-L-arabinofuranosidase C-terminal domain-containing protein, partial [Metabacillus sp.]|nr:alpha-L-arabinofuranosidase C-terminal domain-containing protein [Metabacillus sp.]
TTTLKGQKDEIPSVHLSASKNAQGKVNITLCNLSNQDSAPVSIELRGLLDKNVTNVNGTILTSENMNDRNTFENPTAVEPVSFERLNINENELSFEMPPMSVLLITAS